MDDDDYVFSLAPLADELLAKAPDAHASRSAKTVYGGGGRALGQTLIAVAAGTDLGEHENPGEATVMVVRGRISFSYDGQAWEAQPYELFAVPPEGRHAIKAVEDSVVLLTVARQVG